jgi:hypothetical protein
MLDGVDFHRPLNQSGCALDGLHMHCGGLHERLVWKIDALEFEPMSDRGGQDGESDILAGVEGASGEACGGCEGALVGHGGQKN